MRDSALARQTEAGPVWPRQPEQRLMLAVLEDAVRIFKEYAALSDPHVRRLHAEVERWFEAPPTDWAFDFENICDALGFDASSIRSSLRRGRAATISRLTAVAPSESRRP